MSTAFGFKQMSDDVTDEILADPFFSVIPALSGAAIVVTEDPQDINTAIEAALNNIGLGIMVMLPHANVTNPNEEGPVFDDVSLIIVISEKPTTNRGVTNNGGNNPRADQAAAEIAVLLQGFEDSGGSLYFVTHCLPVENPEYNTWNVGLRSTLSLANVPQPIAPVVASGPASAVTLACATPGAAIFYTLDGTYPAPRNPTSQLYSGPIAATGNLLRARAWLAGYARQNPAETNTQY